MIVGTVLKDYSIFLFILIPLQSWMPIYLQKRLKELPLSADIFVKFCQVLPNALKTFEAYSTFVFILRPNRHYATLPISLLYKKAYTDLRKKCDGKCERKSFTFWCELACQVAPLYRMNTKRINHINFITIIASSRQPAAWPVLHRLVQWVRLSWVYKRYCICEVIKRNESYVGNIDF